MSDKKATKVKPDHWETPPRHLIVAQLEEMYKKYLGADVTVVDWKKDGDSLSVGVRQNWRPILTEVQK